MAKPDYVKTDKMDEHIKAMLELTAIKVMVGVPATKTDRRDEEDHPNITNAALAYIHNHGAPEVGIPARPYLVPGVKRVQRQITAEFKQAGLHALAGDKGKMMRSFNRAGLIAQNAVRAKITEGIPPPLKPGTLKARIRSRTAVKGAKMELQRRAQGLAPSTDYAKPLLMTGQLRAANIYVIRKKGQTI